MNNHHPARGTEPGLQAIWHFFFLTLTARPVPFQAQLRELALFLTLQAPVWIPAWALPVPAVRCTALIRIPARCDQARSLPLPVWAPPCRLRAAGRNVVHSPAAASACRWAWHLSTGWRFPYATSWYSSQGSSGPMYW